MQDLLVERVCPLLLEVYGSDPTQEPIPHLTPGGQASESGLPRTRGKTSS